MYGTLLQMYDRLLQVYGKLLRGHKAGDGGIPACVPVQVPPRVPQGLQAVGLRPALLLQPQQAAQLPPRQAGRPVREGRRDVALPAQGVCALLARPGSKDTGVQVM